MSKAADKSKNDSNAVVRPDARPVITAPVTPTTTTTPPAAGVQNVL